MSKSSLLTSSFSVLIILTLFARLCTYQDLRKPVIGIVSTPSDFPQAYSPTQFSYIKDMYVDFVIAADAIPIAIPWDLPVRDMVTILNSVNGLLFTGGDTSLWEYDANANEMLFSNFTKRVAFIVDQVMKMNDRGVHFPIYGVCQGHQVIPLAVFGKPSAIDHFLHYGQLDTLDFPIEGKESRMFRNMPNHLFSFLNSKKSMYFNHKYGFNASVLEEQKILEDFFFITAKGTDDNGKEFIAALEAKNYPIYTVQYHPERILAEWKNKTHYAHADEAAEAAIILAQFLVSEAKKNSNKFQSLEKLEKFLLANHEHVHVNVTFPKIYFYDKKSPITYHVNPDWSDGAPLDEYDCEHHDCSFILTED